MLKKASVKTGFTLIISLVAIAFLGLTISETLATAPDDIAIKSSVWKKKKYEDPKLTHKKHAEEYKIQCDQCHHIYTDGKNTWKEGQKVDKCETCHTSAKTGKALREASAEEKKLSLYKAFHDNCKGCHKDQQKGPIKCIECHPKLPNK